MLGASVFMRSIERGKRLTECVRQTTRPTSKGFVGRFDLVNAVRGPKEGATGPDTRAEMQPAPDVEVDDGAIQIGQGRQSQQLLEISQRQVRQGTQALLV